MAAIVIDASVVVKWYIPEQFHEQARTLRERYLPGQIDLVAPSLLPYEVLNALRYSGHFEADALAEASRSLSAYGIEWVLFAELGEVAGIARRLDITGYDAAYVALARERAATVYTADETLLEDVAEQVAEERVEHLRELGN